MEVIGICGPSGSGKTTIARYLSSVYNTPTISQDSYSKDSCTNWEIPSSYDYSRIISEIKNSGRPIVILEGFLIFSWPVLRQLIGHKIYIYLPTDEVIVRRTTRYNVEYRNTSGDYVNKTLRPYSEKYMLRQIGYSDLLLDGRRNLHSITADIIEFLGRRLG